MMECYRKIGIYDVANAVDILTRCGKILDKDMSYDVFLQKSINKIIKNNNGKKQKNKYFPYLNAFHRKSSEASQEEVIRM